MTTTFTSSGFLSTTGKTGLGSKKLSLFSPVTLVILLAIVFIFFLTASGETGYSREDSKTINTSKRESVVPDSEMMYKNIVTKGDAIRSVLQ